LNGCLLSDKIGLFAVAGGDIEILMLLEQHGISFIAGIHIAALYHHFSIVEWIYTVNSSLVELSRLRQVLRNAAMSNDVAIGLWLLEEQPCLLEMMNEALEAAAENGSLEFCEMLLGRIDVCPFSVIAAAVRSGGIDLVSRFLSMPGPQFDVHESHELIKEATKGGFLNILQLLLRNDRLVLGSGVSSALLLAARHDRCECIVELLSLPVIDVNFLSPERRSPLHTAIEWGSLAAARILCGHRDINMNIRNGVCSWFPKAFLLSSLYSA
jgi:ankyrin repeat protein